jgi:hypothetical protein
VLNAALANYTGQPSFDLHPHTPVPGSRAQRAASPQSASSVHLSFGVRQKYPSTASVQWSISGEQKPLTPQSASVLQVPLTHALPL